MTPQAIETLRERIAAGLATQQEINFAMLDAIRGVNEAWEGPGNYAAMERHARFLADISGLMQRDLKEAM